MTSPEPAVDVMIQARMGSTRLPGKIMLPLGATTTLGMMIERVKRVGAARQTVILTTRLAEDDVVAELAVRHGVGVFRGEADDVLDRFYRAACEWQSDIIVRLTGDCPFVDPALIDAMAGVYLERWPHIDFLTNCLRRTYPRGLDVEMFSRSLLERLHAGCREPYYREHVVPYVEEHPREFAFFEHMNAVDESQYRLTVDTSEDYRTIVNIYGLFGRDDFSYDDLMGALRRNPHLLVNTGVLHKAYRD